MQKRSAPSRSSVSISFLFDNHAPICLDAFTVESVCLSLPGKLPHCVCVFLMCCGCRLHLHSQSYLSTHHQPSIHPSGASSPQMEDARRGNACEWSMEMRVAYGRQDEFLFFPDAIDNNNNNNNNSSNISIISDAKSGGKRRHNRQHLTLGATYTRHIISS